ncbi:MAG: Smr/MutS family protein [Zoogloeaceae bacterium]|jgi:DNA-nicking Smr family endonuclease|nr:Smr/MutS family protein [Zoogloeaceae bacterium]
MARRRALHPGFDALATLNKQGGKADGSASPDVFRETLNHPVRPELVEGHSLQKQGQRLPQPERVELVQSFPGNAPPSKPPVLSPAEQRLFQSAMEGVRPLPPPDRAEIERPPTKPRPLPCPPRRKILETLSGAAAGGDDLDMDAPANEAGVFLRPGLPRRALADLRKGRWAIQAELDLHGLDREEAGEALGQFLLAALAQGCRAVRVIHGKGLSSPGGKSVLKTLTRQWLARHAAVLAFCPAKPRDGGEGALLVRLKSPSADKRR